MYEPMKIHKYRAQNGETPRYKAYHEFYITRDLGSVKNDEVTAFIDKYIAEFKGRTEGKHGIPQMLFERKRDAQLFADALINKLKIPKEHIAIKAQK